VLVYELNVIGGFLMFIIVGGVVYLLGAKKS
jgi:hypothetical protein